MRGHTKESAAKARASLLAKDPDYYKKLVAKRKTNPGGKNSPGSFKKANKYSRIGGMAGKRGPRSATPGVDIPEDAQRIEDVKLVMEETNRDEDFKPKHDNKEPS